MANLEQPASLEELSTEALVRSFDHILHMPENTVKEMIARRNACNDAIRVLSARSRTIHNESGDNSPDDNSQEESENDRERSLLAEAIGTFRRDMDHLHEAIERMQEAKGEE